MTRGKWFLTLILIILLVGCTDKTGPTGSVADTPENRKAAAKRYLEAVPPQELLENITARMTRRLPEASRKKFQETMDDKKLLKETSQICETALVKHFTPDELNAMTAFFGSPAGKSARNKFRPYMAEIMPQINKELRKVFAQVQEKTPKAQPEKGPAKGEKPKTAPAKPEQAKPAKPATPQVKPEKPQAEHPQPQQPKPEKSKAEQPKPKQSKPEHPKSEEPKK